MRMLAVLAWCGALAGCRVTTGTAGELVLTVTAAQSTIRAGQTLSVTVTAINEGDAPVTFISPDCAFPFEIRDADGELVPHSRTIICAAVLTGPRTLGPGAQTTFGTVWITRDGLRQANVAPGVYHLRPANFHVRGAHVVNRQASVTVTS